MKKFVRRISNRYSKLGKRRKKKQVWRSPKGRDNKMREKRKGCPVVVSLGYKKDKRTKGLVEDKIPRIIRNLNELEKIQKNQIVIIGNVGKKKKIDIIKKAKEKKIEIHKINLEKFLKKNIKKKKEVEKKDKPKTDKIKEKKK